MKPDPMCPTHHVQLRCPICRASELGRMKSPKKAAAARANGLKGGRRKAQASLPTSDDQGLSGTPS